jgi:hypothetical protein
MIFTRYMWEIYLWFWKYHMNYENWFVFDSIDYDNNTINSDNRNNLNID